MRRKSQIEVSKRRIFYSSGTFHFHILGCSCVPLHCSQGKLILTDTTIRVVILSVAATVAEPVSIQSVHLLHLRRTSHVSWIAQQCVDVLHVRRPIWGYVSGHSS